MIFRALTHGAVTFLRPRAPRVWVPFSLGLLVKDVSARILFLLPALGRAIEAVL